MSKTSSERLTYVQFTSCVYEVGITEYSMNSTAFITVFEQVLAHKEVSKNIVSINKNKELTIKINFNPEQRHIQNLFKHLGQSFSRK